MCPRASALEREWTTACTYLEEAFRATGSKYCLASEKATHFEERIIWGAKIGPLSFKARPWGV